MKRVLFLIFSSLLILGACGQVGDNSIKNDNKKSNAPKRNKDSDAKSENQSSKKQSRTYTAQQYNALVDDYNTMINKPKVNQKYQIVFLSLNITLCLKNITHLLMKRMKKTDINISLRVFRLYKVY